jgi:hypothetical protein
MYIKIFILILLIAIIGFLAYKLHKSKRIEHYKNKQLHFIHIPKNAGTTIENLAKENNILWGRFDKEYNNEGKIILDDTYSSKLKLYNFNKVSPWHNYFSKFSKNYKNKHDWFIIVRNPYKWILSHGHYWIKEIEKQDINKWSKEHFNEYIRTKILEQKDNLFGGHYCPQHKFIENNEGETINIIKMENLQSEFNNLMEQYNINIQLDRKDNKSKYKFEEKDLDEKTNKLIQDVYKKDFELFNYKIDSINNLNVESFANKTNGHEYKHFFSVLTRNKDEVHIDEFVKYYLSQGADMIYIIDDHSKVKYSESVLNNNKVEIIDGKYMSIDQEKDLNILYNLIKNKTKWVCIVDQDEFITTRLNKNKTICDELKTTFQDTDCIKIPWVMFCSNSQYEPKNILDITTRWDHDKKHPHPFNNIKSRCRYDEIEGKSIFKTDAFNKVSVHYPKDSSKSQIICKDSVRGNSMKLNSWHKRYSENDIKNSILTCNHYRVSSIDNIIKRCTNTNLKRYKDNKNCVRDLKESIYMEKEDMLLRDK